MNTIQQKLLFKHDLKQTKVSLLVWTLCVVAGVLLLELLLCAILPLPAAMEETMKDTEVTLADMNYMYSPIGFFCQNNSGTLMTVVAFFACSMALAAWNAEEKGGTAELILQMPISRKEVWRIKFLSLLSKYFIFMGSIFVASILSMVAVGGIENCMPSAKETFVFIFSFISPFAQGFIVLCFMFFFSIIKKKSLGTFFAIGITMAFVIGQVIWGVVTQIIALEVFVKTPDWYSIVNLPIIPSMSTINGAIGGSKTALMPDFWVGIASLILWISASISVIVLSYKKFLKREIMG